MESDVWDFRQATDLQTQYQSLTKVEQTAEGIHVQTLSDGFLYWMNPLVHPVDVIVLRVYTPKTVKPGLLWHTRKMHQSMQAEHDLYFEGKSEWQDITIPITDDPHWDWTSDQIALGFPAGADIVIQRISWQRYSTMEKLQEAWKSFFTFDDFRAYSINFLWGPLLASNPVGTATLFDNLPPTAWSIDRVFYALLAIALAVGIVFWAFDRNARGRQKVVFCFWGMFLLIWIVFDMRMTAELISYAVDDFHQYVLPDDSRKEFRTHDDLYTVLAALMPTIKQYDRYVALIVPQSPTYSNLRYQSYPSVPVFPDADTTGIKLWVVIKRNDIKVSSGALVDANGAVLTPQGSVIQRYSDNSFLFAIP